MIKRAYISCEKNEAELEQVEEICTFFQENSVIIEFAPDPGWSFYENIVSAIDRCDAFISIFACGYKDGTWLNAELDYAVHLKQVRERIIAPKPRIFGVRIRNVETPAYVDKIKDIEWLSENKDEWHILLKELKRKY